MLYTILLLSCGEKSDSAAEPTSEPAQEPTAEPAEEPAGEPAEEPAAEPAEEPAEEPAAEPIQTVNGCVGTAYESSVLCSSWMYNETDERSAVFQSGGSGVVVNIASSSISNQNGVDYLQVQSSGIPNYQVTFTQDDVDALNNRPNAATDFQSGSTTAQVGMTYDFGSDISYMSNGSCGAGEGFGWWPPGPVCPTDQDRTTYFPLSPAPAAEGEECETGLGAFGLFVNGVSMFNWSDGASYNSAGVWMNVAAQYESYDLGPCKGHAANGNYHHHDLSACLQDQLEDEGDGHSPVYGFAADGFPINGPYHADGELSLSCWTARDYDDAFDPLGCGGTGERTCLLVDPYDPGLGTTNTNSTGPTTSDVVTSMSGNDFVAQSGFYFEDHYYNPQCTTQGTKYLDEHNGHDHDDLGYHYHITLSFPYFTGPKLYGVVDASVSTASCNGVNTGSQGGGPPPSTDR